MKRFNEFLNENRELKSGSNVIIKSSGGFDRFAGKKGKVILDDGEEVEVRIGGMKGSYLFRHADLRPV